MKEILRKNPNLKLRFPGFPIEWRMSSSRTVRKLKIHQISLFLTLINDVIVSLSDVNIQNKEDTKLLTYNSDINVNGRRRRGE